MMVILANIILLLVMILCFAAGETVQGYLILGVMWVCSVLWRRGDR